MWHSSTSVMSCATIFGEYRIRIRRTGKLNFHSVWVMIEKSSVKLAHATHFTNDFSIGIQIRWQINSALIQVVIKWLLWKFCIWHNSCAVMTFAKFCSDMTPYSGVALKSVLHRIELRCNNRSWNWPLVSTVTTSYQVWWKVGLD